MLYLEAIFGRPEKRLAKLLFSLRLRKKTNKPLLAAVAKTNTESRSFPFFAKLKTLDFAPPPLIGTPDRPSLDALLFECNLT